MANLRLWYSLAGRISRRTYWLNFLLPITGLLAIAGVIDSLMGFVDQSGSAVAIVGLLVIWPAIVGEVKRFHDLGHSGWLLAGVYGGGIASNYLEALIGAGAAVVVALPFAIALFWYYGLKIPFFRGTPGPNQYGPHALGEPPMNEPWSASHP